MCNCELSKTLLCKEECILAWQHVHEDPESCAFDVTFTIWLMGKKDIDLGWVIATTCKYALFPTYSCSLKCRIFFSMIILRIPKFPITCQMLYIIVDKNF
jgi:hypothetical protein